MLFGIFKKLIYNIIFTYPSIIFCKMLLNLGVISSGFGFTEVMKKVGVERRVVTAGKNKSVLDPFKPVKPAEMEIIRYDCVMYF
jgi:hypothetical protein